MIKEELPISENPLISLFSYYKKQILIMLKVGREFL